MEIKNNLKRIREEKEISIEELSSLTSINLETLSEYEENKSTINLEDIIKISKALNVSIDSLINNEEEELKEEETRIFISDSFANGSVKTTGTDIDKIMPPTSRFCGGNHDEKRKTVLDKILAFFERFFGIS